MHQFSDSDTPDSDEGIRFKTDSTRNKESNRKSVEGSSRKRRSSRSRSRSFDKRSRDRDERDRYRERRSYSRRHKSRDRSKERPSKYDRRDNRTKRSASAELKNDAAKRKRDLAKPKERDAAKKPTSTADKDTAKNNGKDLKSTIEAPTVGVVDEAFGPALPPKLLLNNAAAKDTSVSPKRQCKHKKKRSTTIIKTKADADDDESAATAAVEKKTVMSTSPISSDNDSVPEDDDDAAAANKETLSPALKAAAEHRDVIEIEDSDVEPENRTSGDKKANNSSTSDCYGPDIPSKHNEEVELASQFVGPFLPDNLRQKLLETADENGAADVSLSDDDEIEEGEIVGPILPGTKESFSACQIALEERALQYKLDQLSTGNSSSDLKVREDWMLTLPEAGTAAKMGLGPRQFRARAAPDMTDRSGWTDTPTDKEAKQRSNKPAREDNGAEYKAEAEKLEIEERDNEQERMARRHHKKHRKKDKKEKSLLEMHRDKLKSNKKDDEQNVRRPFNRDIDLKVNQFDEAQKKAIYKKAQLLDDRFSKGESKYL